jgi:elongation factor Ts
MKISIDQIKELRSLTQAGMATCKEALEEAEGNLEKAVDLVKAKGLQNVSSRSNRISAEGRVAIFETGNKVTLLEINCDTDFVAKSDSFIYFVNSCNRVLGASDLSNFDGDLTKFKANPFKTLEEVRTEVCSTTGENVVLRRWFVQPRDSNQEYMSYVHNNDQLGVVVTFESDKYEVFKEPDVRALMTDVAMQVAAMNPLAVSREMISLEESQRQRGIFETQLREMNKPEAVWEKIIEGKFNKWYSEVTLLDQESVLVPKRTIQSLLQDLGVKHNCNFKIVSFVRCQVGETVQKPQDNLAESVANLIG